MADELIKKAQRLLLAVERRTKANERDLAEMHALAVEAVKRHGPGAGASPDVVAAVVAPKDPTPDAP